MTKINDTITFPLTEPAEDDFVIGTDDSDTATDADGKTVNFRVGDLLDVATKSASWHPYNSTFYGDSNDGAVFDFAVDGAGITTISCPDFEDGYEYGFIFDGLRSTGTTTVSMVVTYESGDTDTGTVYTVNTGTPNYHFYYLPSTRKVKRDHSPIVVYGSSLLAPGAWVTATGDRPLSVDFTLNTGSFDLGKLLMVRRRDFLS